MGHTQECAFSSRSQVMQMLLVQGAHFPYHCSWSLISLSTLLSKVASILLFPSATLSLYTSALFIVHYLNSHCYSLCRKGGLSALFTIVPLVCNTVLDIQLKLKKKNWNELIDEEMNE